MHAASGGAAATGRTVHVGLWAMSNAVRHTFHTASDPTGRTEPLSRGTGDAHSGEAHPPAPIIISANDMVRAFDLFQPEPGTRAGDEPESEIVLAHVTQPTAVVPFADGQFSRQVARALDAPQPALSLPLGGVAPTEREIAAARALVVGWVAAIAIAAFAFLAQGPSITPRVESPEPVQPAPTSAAEAPAPAVRGDIRLEAPAAKSSARTRTTAREPAATPAPAGEPKR